REKSTGSTRSTGSTTSTSPDASDLTGRPAPVLANPASTPNCETNSPSPSVPGPTGPPSGTQELRNEPVAIPDCARSIAPGPRRGLHDPTHAAGAPVPHASGAPTETLNEPQRHIHP